MNTQLSKRRYTCVNTCMISRPCSVLAACIAGRAWTYGTQHHDLTRASWTYKNIMHIFQISNYIQNIHCLGFSNSLLATYMSFYFSMVSWVFTGFTPLWAIFQFYHNKAYAGRKSELKARIIIWGELWIRTRNPTRDRCPFGAMERNFGQRNS